MKTMTDLSQLTERQNKILNMLVTQGRWRPKWSGWGKQSRTSTREIMKGLVVLGLASNVEGEYYPTELSKELVETEEGEAA